MDCRYTLGILSLVLRVLNFRLSLVNSGKLAKCLLVPFQQVFFVLKAYDKRTSPSDFNWV